MSEDKTSKPAVTPSTGPPPESKLPSGPEPTKIPPPSLPKYNNFEDKTPYARIDRSKD